MISLGKDEQAWFAEMLVFRASLVEKHYPSRYIFAWDLWQACDVVRRYISDCVSQLIEVTINFPKSRP